MFEWNYGRKLGSSAVAKMGMYQVAPKGQEEVAFIITFCYDFLDVGMSVFSVLKWCAFSGLEYLTQTVN